MLAGHTEVRPRRHEQGWTKGLLVSAPVEGGKTGQWLEEEWDRLGHPRKITDSSGFQWVINYDDQGRLRSFGRLREDGKLAGTSLVYDPSGLVSSIDSTWEREKREYAVGGALKRIEVERQGAKSVMMFDAQGRQTNRQGFDGGLTAWLYDSGEARAQLRAVDLPNRGRIDYRWGNGTGRGSGEISIGSAVVKTQSDANGRVVAMTWGKRAGS